jgi:hypothetical protein
VSETVVNLFVIDFKPIFYSWRGST